MKSIILWEAKDHTRFGKEEACREYEAVLDFAEILGEKYFGPKPEGNNWKGYIQQDLVKVQECISAMIDAAPTMGCGEPVQCALARLKWTVAELKRKIFPDGLAYMFQHTGFHRLATRIWSIDKQGKEWAQPGYIFDPLCQTNVPYEFPTHS